jgi:hypothetical protein
LFFFSFIHMCIQCLGHFSTLPPPPPLPIPAPPSAQFLFKRRKVQRGSPADSSAHCHLQTGLVLHYTGRLVGEAPGRCLGRKILNQPSDRVGVFHSSRWRVSSKWLKVGVCLLFFMAQWRVPVSHLWRWGGPVLMWLPCVNPNIPAYICIWNFISLLPVGQNIEVS